MTQIKEILEERGYEFSSLGFNETALLPEDALECIDIARKTNVPILGGDLYQMVDGNISMSPTYENWHCDRMKDEALADYCIRSCNEAYEFIERYASPRTDVINLVVLVF